MTQSPLRAIVAKFDSRCACGTVLKAGTTVYWAPGQKAICGLCLEKQNDLAEATHQAQKDRAAEPDRWPTHRPVEAPSVPDGDDLANLGLDALEAEALVLSKWSSDYYDNDGGQGPYDPQREAYYGRVARALIEVDDHIARRRKLLKPVQPQEVKRWEQMSDEWLARTLEGLTNDWQAGTVWRERIDDKVRSAVVLAIQLKRTQRVENRARYDERVARVRADEQAGKTTPAAVYAELLVLAKRLEDPAAQEVWAQEMRKAVR